MPASSDRQGVWTRFWAQGALHSCGGTYGQAYGGAIGAFWRAVFDALRAPSQVLDLACGNGPLARLLVEQRPEADVTCDAVDLADVSPPWLATSPHAKRLQFHSRVRAEALPFPAASFDLVISQYGFEYTDHAATAAELQRVRRPGSTVALVLHARAARPVQLSREEVLHIDLLTSTDGLLASLHDVCVPFARAATAEGRRALSRDAQAERLRLRLDAAQDAVQRQATASTVPDLLHDAVQWVGQVLQRAQAEGPAAAQAQVRAIEASLRDARLRLEELQAHALDEPTAQALAQALRRDASDVATVDALVDQGHLMGWSLVVRPAV